MKTFTKTALCAAYKYSGALALHEAAGALAGRSCQAILLLHRVTDDIPADGLTVGTARFRQVCRLLRRRFRVVPLGEVFRRVRSGEPALPRTVAITFDDCYRDNLAAARVLAEHGLPACFFLPTAYVGTDRVFPWDRGLKRMANLTWDDVRELAHLGFEIGSHTVTHPDLGTASHEEVRRELFESKQVLEAQLGRRVRWFAYPFGGTDNFRDEWLPLVEEAGYDGCVSGFGGLVQPGAPPRLLPRVPVPAFASLVNLEVYLTGCLGWYHALKRRLGLYDSEEELSPERAYKDLQLTAGFAGPGVTGAPRT